ncbi:hypothetical protein ACFVZR_29990 [Streptomyces sp. NPDC058316]|uniref:hypothetical protein n=1 Tax=unclassified Streptomyces TaxID=2593676 RepID=UPI0033209355
MRSLVEGTTGSPAESRHSANRGGVFWPLVGGRRSFQVLPTLQHFEPASELVTEGTGRDHVVCGDDVDEHVRAVRAYGEADFDDVYVNRY